MKNDATDITLILDRSGSMSAIADDIIGGVNSLLDEQKKTPGDCRFSLVQFDTQDPYEIVTDALPIGEVKPLSKDTFNPRGGTPLLDALGRGIVATGERLKAMPEDQRPGKVLFVIVTDGQENASREYKRERIMEMVREQTDVYKWTFVYIGANQDAIQEATSFGVSASNAMSYAYNSKGAASMGQTMSKVSTAMRCSVAGASLTAAIDDEDRKWQTDAGLQQP